MSSQPIDRVHPVSAFASAAVARLDTLTSVPVWSLSPAEQLNVLRDLAVAEAQLSALRLRVLAEADRSGAALGDGAATAADWVAVETRQVRRHARSDLKLARALESHVVLSSACDAGRVSTAQARAIVTALDRLPSTGEFAVSSEQRDRAEAHLVGLAAHHDAAELGVLGRRVFEVVAPEVAEAFEGRVLEQQEARALRRTTLQMWEDDEGTCHGRFRIPSLHGQMLQKVILAISSPVRQGAGADESSGIDSDLPTPARHGIAFTQLLESMRNRDVPRTGGCGATVVVTMTLDQLLGRLDEAGVCTLDTGGRISATEARRLACAAGLIPMVLGGPSQVLDVGRKRRLHTEPQRLAMGVRDRGCTADGCHTPPGMCHAHHDMPWSAGGSTSVESGRLLCPHHHRRIHDPAYETTRAPNGRVRFHRRT